MWGVGVEGVEGMVEYFQECFWVGVVFFDLGGDGDWVRIGRRCVSKIRLGFFVFWWEITSGDDDFSDFGDW